MLLNPFFLWLDKLNSSGFSSLVRPTKWLGLLSMPLILLACMESDPNGPKSENAKGQEIQEPNPLAGSSSSTNWPPTLGGTDSILAQVRLDTSLHFNFLKLTKSLELGKPSGTSLPVKLSGKITFYKVGPIPALDPVPSISKTILDTDSLELPNSFFEVLNSETADSLYFSIHIEIDSLEAWAFNFGYAPNTKTFFKTELSNQTETSMGLRLAKHFIQGYIDTTTWLANPTLAKNITYSFYIPGTTFFWRTDSDSVSIGPIPESSYPLRLLRLTSVKDGMAGTRVEIFSVKTTKISQSNNSFYQFSPGDLLFSLHSNKPLYLKGLP